MFPAWSCLWEEPWSWRVSAEVPKARGDVPVLPNPGCRQDAQCKAAISEPIFRETPCPLPFPSSRGAAPVPCLWKRLGCRELLHLPPGAPASPRGCCCHLHKLLLPCRAGAPTRLCHFDLEEPSTGSSFSSCDTQENYGTTLASSLAGY